MKMKPTSVIMADLGIEPSGRVQKFFVDNCIRHMDKYIPMDTGNLAGTYTTTNTSVTYTKPYARYQYYGVSKNGKSLHYSTEKHAYAGKYWDRRMVSAEIQDVVKEVQEEIRKNGN